MVDHLVGGVDVLLLLFVNLCICMVGYHYKGTTCYTHFVDYYTLSPLPK